MFQNKQSKDILLRGVDSVVYQEPLSLFCENQKLLVCEPYRNPVQHEKSVVYGYKIFKEVQNGKGVQSR